MLASNALPTPERSLAIAQARQALIHGDAADLRVPPGSRIEPWIARSWQRCIEAGQQPQQRVSFEPVSRGVQREVMERNRALVSAARPVIERLSRAIADTRYFAVLTDAEGIVVDLGVLPDGTDDASRYARNIGRIGVDLSERAIGTSAIGTALAEQESVWLHGGEHFFDDTSVYSCAGAPLFGPQGDCIGMLDLTGVQVAERPELRHLATLSARSIENALVLRAPCAMLLRLAWPGCATSEAAEGLLCIDGGGNVTGANAAARQMLHQPLARSQGGLHCNDLFALPLDMLFDAARRGDAVLEVPLWSGLRVQVRPQRGDGSSHGAAAPEPRPRLRDVETALIRKAVADARGNVAEAARALGISRATVYRKLWRGRGTGTAD
ncbi:histidine kinase [Variovorax paradoxus]|jgi:transcriptional regulator of acetoin/glycerol metabolism|uniref:helix-turn-helix domain-containing protein n=1 Tax=Variovorax TaxID=34072 RepID=UPI0006E4C5F3|nr:helix-turn-helix domain-containing protein [Variovorax sp. CY25R-8]KPU96278.1 histidine kinase [Variovorax paradoxus]KPV08508.1 histidine kinase [Variovorax paradoxus]KPV13660.1 histidine kinase [Variovorax paradoxus]KPV23410.1 histidine kinase [Variovorax paradoxus]KPV36502.1 histidine kinase [Variovorax paradoxus]